MMKTAYPIEQSGSNSSERILAVRARLRTELAYCGIAFPGTLKGACCSR